MLSVKRRLKGGLARKYAIKKGDQILAFDGYDAVDVLDYVFFDSKPSFTLTVGRKGKIREIAIEKEEDQSLGLLFDDDGLELKTCHNKCMFCFVDQMPKGMRESLYVKDDDYRQSFLHGNFVTLTNLTQKDEQRIIRLKLSPLYVSVHSMQAETRCRLTGNRFAGEIERQLHDFAAAGITLHTQVVLVRGENDGEDLTQTARKLFALSPWVRTMAVVPCGVTAHRDGLTPIADIDGAYAQSVIEQISALNAEFGVPFIQVADEFYFRAGLPVPPPHAYGDYEQIENGVGLTTKFREELEESQQVEETLIEKTKFLVMSGTSASAFVAEWAQKICSNTQHATAVTVGVKNTVFGETVNCTGLLCGKDIIAAAKQNAPFDVVVLNGCTLRQGEDVFLDGLTAKELANIVGVPLRFTDGTGQSFVSALTKQEFEKTVYPSK